MNGISDMLMSRGPTQSLALAAGVLTCVLVLVCRALLGSRYPKNLPRLGAEEGVPWTEVKKRFATHSLSVYNDAYENVSKASNPMNTSLTFHGIVLKEGQNRTGTGLWASRRGHPASQLCTLALQAARECRELPPGADRLDPT
jgi:hypothetical protein